MASAIRDFSYMFTYSSKLERYGVLPRISVAFSGVISVFLARLFSADLILEVARLILVLVFELSIISYFRGVRSAILAIRIVLFFVVIGTAIFYSSYFAGWATPEPISIALGAITLVALFLAFSSLFQLISLREWRRILVVLGLRKYAFLMSLVISQIPATMFYASEAFATVKLKYGGKRLYRVIVPLVLLSAYSARNLFESHLLYGVYYESRLTPFRKGDLPLCSAVAAFAIVFTLLEPLLLALFTC